MEAILVIYEMPTECIECQFCRVLADDKPTETRCILTAQRNEDGVNTRAEWCPLKRMPQKKEETFAYWIAHCNDPESYICGWNDCIEELEKC